MCACCDPCFEQCPQDRRRPLAASPCCGLQQLLCLPFSCCFSLFSPGHICDGDHRPPLPPPRPERCCVQEEKLPPAIVAKDLCARFRMPPYRCIKDVRVELLPPCRKRCGIMLNYKVKVAYSDCCGCCRTRFFAGQSLCDEICSCGEPCVCLLGSPVCDLSGCCLTVRFQVGIENQR